VPSSAAIAAPGGARLWRWRMHCEVRPVGVMRSKCDAGFGVGVRTKESRSSSVQLATTRIPPLRTGRHAVTRRALTSMAHLAPAWLRFGAGAVRFEQVRTSATRSNLLLSRPCASAPPMPRSLARAGTSLRHVPARASVAAGSHGGLSSRSTMPSIASAARSRRSRVCVRAIGLRSAVLRGATPQ
jgi:hypothetical protein